MNLDFNPKEVVAAAMKRGWCTAPGKSARQSDRQILTLKRHDKGLTARGTVPRSPVYGVPREVAVLLADFLRQFTAPFVVLDFQLFLSRSNINLKPVIVSCYLSRAVESGLLNRVGRKPSGIKFGSNVVYQSSKSAVSNQ
jgi:hypothetical protein